MLYNLIERSRLFKAKSVFKSAFIAAVIMCMSGCSGSDDFEVFAKIQGTVTDHSTGSPLSNASVTLTPSGLSKITDDNGFFRFDELDTQQYTLTVQKSGYQPNRKTVNAVSGETQQVDIQLTPIPE